MFINIEIEVRHWKLCVLHPSKITCEYKISTRNPAVCGNCIQSRDTICRDAERTCISQDQQEIKR